MASFSKRYGYEPLTKIQKESLDVDTRNQLWNLLKDSLWLRWSDYQYGWTEEARVINSFSLRLWTDHLRQSSDNFRTLNPHDEDGLYRLLKNFFLEREWHEAYSLLEYIIQNWPFPREAGNVQMKLNELLEREACAYRFVDGEIVPITSDSELDAIEKALKESPDNVAQHLKKAVSLFADRRNRDYENSIKESICALEAFCGEIVGESNATLGDVLKKIKKIHPAFAQGLSKLYGFTSDEAGIRHGATGEPLTDITQADAKLFVVLVSAFVNYMAEKKLTSK